MLGLGWTEMLVIGVVALIFIGPKDLPVVMGRIGKVIGQVQRMGREFQREINRTTGLDEVRNLRSTITDPLKKTADEIRKEFNAIGKDGQQSPTGALKPTDPKTESVVDAIKDQAGMAEPKKTTDELAADYGFKPSVAAKPVKGTRTTPPTFADTTAGKAKAAAEAPVKAARSTAKPASAKKTPARTSTKTEAPAGEAKKPVRRTAAKPAAAKAASAKPAKATAAPATAAVETPATEQAKPAKPRAPRKKPAKTAEKS
ncbi:MAG: Sec-independent protein translocase protein TatB [Devosia sp.]|uniref:Sec-independent protein translocase protein TatB n=1 Tax=Devosia sp. TaxID=1871048 RepID=UPI0024CAB9D3|nr:Sec-independent protein translocase protein TatB [Devosia sp.]UYO00074.1 MAG: Sec-independent protein translocase protein TatB [Devosia sp.]